MLSLTNKGPVDNVQVLVTVTILEKIVAESVTNFTVSYHIVVHINSSVCSSKQECPFQVPSKLICFTFCCYRHYLSSLTLWKILLDKTKLYLEWLKRVVMCLQGNNYLTANVNQS